MIPSNYFPPPEWLHHQCYNSVRSESEQVIVIKVLFLNLKTYVCIYDILWYMIFHDIWYSNDKRNIYIAVVIISVVIHCLNNFAAIISAPHGHLQPDPSDPSKWQVVQTTSQTPTPIGPLSPADSPQQQQQQQSTDVVPGKRLRRVACTCPNCRDSEGR